MQLKDLLVIELASVLAGPAVGMWLAELGARVIKVEHHRLGGDVTRSWKLPSEAPDDDRPAYFCAVNWGKESIGVDLRHPDGKQIVDDLIARADIVLASFKPGDAVKLGVDEATLRQRHPSLIYADLTAYGEGDERVGFDAIIQAEAGFTFMNGAPEGPSVKMPVALMDLLAAHQLKEGILLALLHRFQTGEGRLVRTSLIGAGLTALANQATNWLVGGHIPQRMGSDHPNIVPYGSIFTTLDDKGVVLAVGNNGQFQRLLETLGHPEWLELPAFSTNRNRVLHREEVKAALAEAIRQWDRDELLAQLRQAKVPAGAVYDMAESLAQPAAQALRLQGPSKQGLRSIALSGIPQHTLSEPPQMGIHGAAICVEVLGYSEEKIERLRGAGAMH